MCHTLGRHGLRTEIIIGCFILLSSFFFGRARIKLHGQNKFFFLKDLES